MAALPKGLKGGFFGAEVKVIGKDAILTKLERAEANILANNLVMVEQMLGFVKAEVVPQIPIGPGHFGYHLRDTFHTDVKVGKGQLGTKVSGALASAVQGYWREYGTLGHARIATVGPRAHRRIIHFTAKEARMAFESGQFGKGGERAFLTAHHALAGIKKFINFYYGGLAKWWHV